MKERKERHRARRRAAEDEFHERETQFDHLHPRGCNQNIIISQNIKMREEAGQEEGPRRKEGEVTREESVLDESFDNMRVVEASSPKINVKTDKLNTKYQRKTDQRGGKGQYEEKRRHY